MYVRFFSNLVIIASMQKFYNLISAFYNITGVPMLLNTSFNCQEPIVETPANAWNTYRKTQLDAVVIGNEVTTK